MTTQREMELAYAAQEEIIDTLYEIGDDDLAARLERCMTARQQRHYGDGWPYSCRSAACIWCRRAMVRGWWFGMRYWSAAATTSSLAIISIRFPAGLPDAVRRLRRGMSGTEQRGALGDGARSASVGGDHTALVLITHQGIGRCELLDVLSRRWPDVVAKKLEQEEPTWTMTPDEAAVLGSRRRGVEPLRIVIMPQRIQRMVVAPAPVVEQMPIAI
jgi:hypothetical protein